MPNICERMFASVSGYGGVAVLTYSFRFLVNFMEVFTSDQIFMAFPQWNSRMAVHKCSTGQPEWLICGAILMLTHQTELIP